MKSVRNVGKKDEKEPTTLHYFYSSENYVTFPVVKIDGTPTWLSFFSLWLRRNITYTCFVIPYSRRDLVS